MKKINEKYQVPKIITHNLPGPKGALCRPKKKTDLAKMIVSLIETEANATANDLVALEKLRAQLLQRRFELAKKLTDIRQLLASDENRYTLGELLLGLGE